MTPGSIEPTSDRSLAACAKALEPVLLDVRVLAEAPVLLRGFDIGRSNDLSTLLTMLDLEPTDYVGGNSPRTRLGGSVYTSTEYSPSASITLHQELSYEWEVPDLLFFLCGTPAQEGGAT